MGLPLELALDEKERRYVEGAAPNKDNKKNYKKRDKEDGRKSQKNMVEAEVPRNGSVGAKATGSRKRDH